MNASVLFVCTCLSTVYQTVLVFEYSMVHVCVLVYELLCVCMCVMD